MAPLNLYTNNCPNIIKKTNSQYSIYIMMFATIEENYQTDYIYLIIEQEWPL